MTGSLSWRIRGLNVRQPRLGPSGCRTGGHWNVRHGFPQGGGPGRIGPEEMDSHFTVSMDFAQGSFDQAIKEQSPRI